MTRLGWSSLSSDREHPERTAPKKDWLYNCTARPAPFGRSSGMFPCAAMRARGVVLQRRSS